MPNSEPARPHGPSPSGPASDQLITEYQPPAEQKAAQRKSRDPTDSGAERLRMPSAPGYVGERRLGSGAFGEVWLAHQSDLGTPVAIKFADFGQAHLGSEDASAPGASHLGTYYYMARRA